jgi:hypothetical protein
MNDRDDSEDVWVAIRFLTGSEPFLWSRKQYTATLILLMRKQSSMLMKYFLAVQILTETASELEFPQESHHRYVCRLVEASW